MTPSVFINYRRDDSDGQARLIFNALKERLGDGAVFMDVEGIEPGEPWPEHIRQALHTADTVVAVIGKEWLRIRDEDERRRIDLDDDWVRIELETALAAGKRVIPVYVRGAIPLKKTALPASIQDLCERESISTRHDHWKGDLELLLKEFYLPLPCSQIEEKPQFQLDRKQRLGFLEQVAKDVTHRLASSVHSARFLDLGVQHDPSAVGSMWGYRNPKTKKDFPSLDAAFKDSKKRLLLLGHPGSGKTTALLHLAELQLREARKDEDTPVPFFVNLSKYNRPTAARTNPETARLDEKFDDWLAEEMAAVPGMTKAQAKQWIVAGKVAALLDGLDEFNDDKRSELAHLINVSFLQRHPSMVVVICSRTNDYQLLRGTENSIQLNESVELQPLNEAQIVEYLHAANAASLCDAILEDPNLAALAKTPLTLSMLALAYGGLPPEQMPKALSLADSRNRLFEAYVDRRLQREARRKAGKQMNDSREDDVPIEHYHYHPEEVYRWLGLLAMVLSQRMTTVFSIRDFYALLTSSGISGNPKIWLNSVRFAWGTWLSLLALIATAPILLVPLDNLIWAPAIVAACFVGASLTCPKNENPEKLVDRASNTNRLANVNRTISKPAGLIAYSISAIIATTSLSHLISKTFQWGHPTPLAICIIFSLSLSAIFITSKQERDDGTLRFGAISLLIVISGACTGIFASKHPLLDLESSWSMAIATTFTLGITFPYAIGERPNLRSRIAFIACLCAAAAALCLMITTIGNPDPITLAVATCLTVTGFSAVAKSNSTAISMWLAGTIILGVLFHSHGIAAGIIGALLPFAFLPIAKRETIRIQHWSIRTHDRLLGFIVSKFLSPSTWLAWSIARAFPFQKSPFIKFCEQIHLLKESRLGGIEFIHRLLRDYFALRQLGPLVGMLGGNGRLDAIRALGYQGEAGLDLLIEIAEQGNASDCSAAIAGLSHIPSPMVAKIIERHIHDPRTEVRASVVRSLRRLPEAASFPIFTKIVPLGNGCEIEPLLEGSKLPESYANWLLENWGAHTKQTILSLINHKDENIHLNSLYLATQTKAPESIEPLLKAVTQSDTSKIRQIRFINALKSIKDRRAALPLSNLLENSRYDLATKMKIIEALSTLAEPKVAPALLNHIKHKRTPQITYACAVTIIQLGTDHDILQLASEWLKIRRNTRFSGTSKLDQWLRDLSKNRHLISEHPRFPNPFDNR